MAARADFAALRLARQKIDHLALGAELAVAMPHGTPLQTTTSTCCCAGAATANKARQERRRSRLIPVEVPVARPQRRNARVSPLVRCLRKGKDLLCLPAGCICRWAEMHAARNWRA